MYVNHVQEFESAGIDLGVELEIRRPKPKGIINPVTPHRAVDGVCPRSFPGSGLLQVLPPPETCHPLVIDGPTLPQP